MNTKFYEVSLPSIHYFGLICSCLVELKPKISSLIADTNIAIRYHCKRHKVEELQAHLSKMHQHITRVYSHLVKPAEEQLVSKIDIFFISDKYSHGYFTPGMVFLEENCLSAGFSIKLCYLLTRAMVGSILLERGGSSMGLD